ncbi:sigma-B regulation protein RsbQ [Salirhabdus euzebyi]|uniref:Sigma-B regulation protein RsbQ n=1 Tax=Salirhabdus euzebyi TaxID=394506 RepID=A0A841Q405_9BACI|nr:alpha/beta hydrolase [Salirhabdus euzebyi]MBB6453124.1 sigma-B regulation protein RsbQ [Salirhabdus euzebyi]
MAKSVLTRNNVTVKGEGEQPIIFASGFGFDQTVWSSVSNSFEQDFQIIQYDYVGFGDSDIAAYDQAKYSTLSGYVSDLLEIFDELKINNAIFVGHSIGSMIGILASTKRPELFSKLVLIGPSPYFLNEPPTYYGGFDKDDLDHLIDMMEKNYLEWVSNIAPTITNDPNRLDVTMDIEDRFYANNPTITRQFAEVIFFGDNRPFLPKVTVPSLIIQCSNDVFVPDSVAEYMKVNLPNATITYSNSIGHCPHLSHPEKTVKLIKEYINEQTKVPIEQVGMEHE